MSKAERAGNLANSIWWMTGRGTREDIRERILALPEPLWDLLHDNDCCGCSGWPLEDVEELWTELKEQTK